MSARPAHAHPRPRGRRRPRRRPAAGVLAVGGRRPHCTYRGEHQQQHRQADRDGLDRPQPRDVGGEYRPHLPGDDGTNDGPPGRGRAVLDPSLVPRSASGTYSARSPLAMDRPSCSGAAGGRTRFHEPTPAARSWSPPTPGDLHWTGTPASAGPGDAHPARATCRGGPGRLTHLHRHHERHGFQVVRACSASTTEAVVPSISAPVGFEK
jgi:hypothetical protein